MNIPFTKMHGRGNDFVLIDCRSTDYPVEQYARFIADRQFGIGCDQIILVETSSVASVAMGILNPDGSRAEMCGNGIRAFAKYLWTKEDTWPNPMQIETGAGILEVFQREDGWIRVDMGAPQTTIAAIGADADQFPDQDAEAAELNSVDWPKEVRDGRGISMGNPHIVFQVDDVDAVDLAEVGSTVEQSGVFPNRINVEFAQIQSRQRVKVRVWERGAGATLACGTGACAVAAAGILADQLDSMLTVALPGGELEIQWTPGEHMFMSGPATEVASGTLDLDAAKAWEEARHAV